MRKLVILFTVLLTSNIALAQQEIKIDILDALAFKSIEVSYEFYFNKESSAGIATLFNLEKHNSKTRYNENMVIAPYFRYYVPTTEDWGFFGELFLGINSGEKKVKVDDNEVLKKYTDGALGVSGGIKYLASKDWTLDAHVGVGRNLFSNNSYSFVPRFGVNVGYRFW